MTAIEADAVSYRVDSTALVEAVSFAVDAGEFLAVVGPNGAGKSTLLRLLAGELDPSSGAVKILGDPTRRTSLAELAKRRSFLGQLVASEVPFTAREVVQMGRYPHRDRPENSPAEDDDAVADALERMDVSGLGDRVLKTLSSGEEQRVHLARILAQQAPVTLLDEPTTALDVGHQQLVARTLRSLAGGGAAVVAVMHDLNLAASFADRVLLLDQGRAVELGSPHEVFRSESLSAVYDHPITVIDHPFRSGPLVLPLEA